MNLEPIPIHYNRDNSPRLPALEALGNNICTAATKQISYLEQYPDAANKRCLPVSKVTIVKEKKGKKKKVLATPYLNDLPALPDSFDSEEFGKI